LFGGGGAPGGEGVGAGGGSGGTGGASHQVGNESVPGRELTGAGGSGYESSAAAGSGGGGVIIMRIPSSNAPVITVPGSVGSVAPGDGYKYYLFSGVATTSYPVSVS
jgi:hypothetical protein